MTRQELVDGIAVAVTTVNRVVDSLTEAGAVITREIAADGRQAIFQFLDIQDPVVKRPYMTVGDTVLMVAARQLGDNLMVDLSVEDTLYRGRVSNWGTSRVPRRGRLSDPYRREVGGDVSVSLTERSHCEHQ